jgi:hypothetical protein
MDVIELAAELMSLSARTAPKASGQDFIETKVVTGDDLKRLNEDMVKYGVESGKKNFNRDGKNVERSGAVLLISLNKPKKQASIAAHAVTTNATSYLTLKRERNLTVQYVHGGL